jgi:hypothetical protein
MQQMKMFLRKYWIIISVIFYIGMGFITYGYYFPIAFNNSKEFLPNLSAGFHYYQAQHKAVFSGIIWPLFWLQEATWYMMDIQHKIK